MEKKNGFLYAKAAVAALCGAFTAAFGWLGWLVLAWAVCMALDWLSGSAAAAAGESGPAPWRARASGTRRAWWWSSAWRR